MGPKEAVSSSEQKLILGIDVGTTFAGISYCLLEPGKKPNILPVTRFPPQDHIGGDSKVPSILYYDQSGKARALGAEALQESVIEQAEAEGWEKAECHLAGRVPGMHAQILIAALIRFKLHLRPASSGQIRSLPPLPKNKSATAVFADFLRYLFKCAEIYITEHYQSGSALWGSLASGIEFVLTHPNGWEGEQQAMMRRAAIRAGLVPDNREGRERIHFITEGEASLNFCILNGLATNQLKQGKGVVIIDAGGGTVDISAYRTRTQPTATAESFEEITRPQCLFEGSIFVSSRAKDYLQEKLNGSKYADDVEHICECFDKTTKLKFRSADEWSYIKFGRPRDRDDELNITNGQMKLPGTVVVGFFQPSLDAIIAAMITQQRASNFTVSSVLLVGGFAASEWLYMKLKKSLGILGLEVSRPDSHVNKAVSDGAVAFYLNHFVSARVSRHTYGVRANARYDPKNPEHVANSESTFTDFNGDLMSPNRFSSILQKDVRVSETKEFSCGYCVSKRTQSELSKMDVEILCYRGTESNPQWLDDSDDYSVLCTIHADTSQIAKSLKPRQSRFGTYHYLELDVVLSFGLTELKAEIAWVENGVEKRGPAEILYENV